MPLCQTLFVTLAMSELCCSAAESDIVGMYLGRWQGGVLHGSRNGPLSLLLAVERQDAHPAQLHHVHPQQPAPKEIV